MSTVIAENVYRDPELPELALSETSCRLVLLPGEKYTHKITVSGADRRRVMGIAVSDHRRILLSDTELNGISIDLMFGIDTKGLRPGDHIDGTIRFITNFGEDAIPVHVEIASDKRRQNEKEPRSLDDFAGLCQRSIREGFRMFTSERFRSLLTGTDAQYRALYRGMSKNPVTYRNLEEFLAASGRKLPLEFSVDRGEAAFLNLKHSERGVLYLYKNTWGYAELNIEVRGSFIHVLKKQILTEEFVGKVFELEYIVDHERLGKGISRGEIIIHGLHQEIHVGITATVLDETELVPDQREGRLSVSLARGYLARLSGRMEETVWEASAEDALRQLQELAPDNPDYILCRAYLSYWKEDQARAMEYLWPIKEGEITLSDPGQKAAYLYLAKTIGLLPEEKMNILPKLKEYYQETPGSYLLLRLMVTEAGTEDLPERRLERLKLCYEAGSRSPFLFLEGWKLLQAEERLLRSLSPFSVRLLQFAARYGLLSEPMLLRAAFLSHNLKHFSERVFRVLSAGWKQYPRDEVLEAITALITKGQPVSREYHRWYAEAIDRDLRITNLYEYYMETIEEVPEDGFPLPVLMYFSASDTLNDRKRALLYAGIISHRDTQPEIYQMYLGKMHAFAERALEAGMINDDFALIYRTFFQKIPDGRTAALMAGVMFAHRMEFEDDSVRNIFICYEGIEQEECFPVIGKIAYPCIYTKDAAIVFEDSRRRRFCTGVTWTLTPLFDSAKAAQAALQQNVRNAGLLYHGCGAHAHEMHVRKTNVPVYRIAEKMSAFTEQYRQMIRRKLLNYYLGQPDDFDRIDFVNQIDPEQYAAADKAGTVSLLMEEGKYEEVFSLISEYGYERVGEGDLLQLASRMIMRRDQAYDEELLYLTMRVYNSGKYDDNMLIYLRTWYDGPIRVLSGLWKKLAGFQLETGQLTEKILKQAVFAHVFPLYEDEILRDFMRYRGNMKLASSYLGAAARAHLTADRPMPDALYECIERLMDQETAVSTGSQICLLKHYSELDRLSEQQTAAAEQLLRDLMERGIRFGFYQELPPELTERYQLQDKLYLEEHLRPGAQAAIHYRLQEGAMIPGEWIHEPMQEMYHGIYVKELLLFYGETIHYYVTEIRDGVEYRMKEHRVSITGADLKGDTRFAMLNRMLKARADKDDTAYLQELNAYQWKQAFVDELLPIIE